MSTPTQSDKDRVVIFDTTLRDGEQCPGATMTHEEKLEVAELLDDDGRRHHRGRLSHRLRRRLRRRPRDRQAREEFGDLRALARLASKDIDRCAEAIKPARRKRIHTFLSTSPVHMKYKLQKEPHEVYEMVIAPSDARARPHRRRRMVGGGRHPHRIRFPLPLRRGRDQGRRHHHQYPRHRRLHGAGGIPHACSSECARPCPIPTRRSSPCTVTTTSAWRSPIRLPASRAARGRSNAASTASASAPAMPRSRKW